MDGNGNVLTRKDIFRMIVYLGLTYDFVDSITNFTITKFFMQLNLAI